MRDASAVHKNLLSGCSQLSAIKTKAHEIRTKHYAMTCPWTDNGSRIVKTDGFPDYIDCMSAMQDEFNTLVDEFLRDYEDHIMVAQANLGDLFNDDEYPDVNAVRSKFDCRIKPYPITDVSDWRLDVGKDAQTYVDDAIKEYSSIFQEQIQTAMGDIHRRLHDVLSRMSERIDYAGKHDKKIFRDTLLENVFEVVELMKTCNLTNDTQMTAQAEAVEKALRGVSPDALRDSSHLRATTKRKIDDVINALPSINL